MAVRSISFAVKRVPEVIEKSLFHAGLSTSDIDWLVLHQANQRILDAVADRLGVPAERVVSNMAKHGNTAAASIPIALDEGVRAGKIQPGDILRCLALGQVSLGALPSSNGAQSNLLQRNYVNSRY